MAERLKRAAAWLGLVTDDRYAEYDDAESQELTEGLSREEMLGSKAAQRRGNARRPGEGGERHSAGDRAARLRPLRHADAHPARLSPTDG